MIIVSSLMQSTGLVISAVSTRQGGVSPWPLGLNLSSNVGDTVENVRANRGLFFQKLGILPEQAAIPHQVHSCVVQYANAPGNYPSCDGLVTDTPGVYLCVTVADCLPVFILDTERKVVAAIHAGWRGTASMIAQKGIGRMIEVFHCRPEHMVAYVGPGAGACCYSVGAEVAKVFAADFKREDRGKVFIDLKAAIVAQLTDAGIARAAIDASPHCTIHNSDLFHSYRRDKERSGRMMGVIGLKT